MPETDADKAALDAMNPETPKPESVLPPSDVTPPADITPAASPDPERPMPDYVVTAEAPDIKIAHAKKDIPLYLFHVQAMDRKGREYTHRAMELMANDETEAITNYCNFHQLNPNNHKTVAICLEEAKRRKLALSGARKRMMDRGISARDADKALAEIPV